MNCDSTLAATAPHPEPMTWTCTKPANGIENFFAKLKPYRAIASRYNKRSANLIGAIYLAAAVIWLI
jgi:transposase